MATAKHDKKINVWGAYAARGIRMLHCFHGITYNEIYHDIVGNQMLPSTVILFRPENYILYRIMIQNTQQLLIRTVLISSSVASFIVCGDLACESEHEQ